MTLQVQDKTVVVPGEILATGLDFLPGWGTYREGETIHAGRLGQIMMDGRTIKLVPVSGNYTPRIKDTIIAEVTDVTMSGWLTNIRSAWNGMLPLKDATSEYVPRGADLTQYFAVGDFILTTISNVTSQNLVDLSMRGPGARKLRDGRILHVTPCKVPRVIGKKGSMIGMIKTATDSQIIVGQNGVIWVSGREAAMEVIACQAIEKIENESHTSGLTEKIRVFLTEKTGKQVTTHDSTNAEGNKQ